MAKAKHKIVKVVKGSVRIDTGNALEWLKGLPAKSVQCCITSPPYFGLRDYGTEPVGWPEVEYVPMAGLGLPPLRLGVMSTRLGLEPSIKAYIGHLVLIMRGVRRVLRDDGVLWLNMGDTYASGHMSGKHGPNSTFGQDSKRGQSITQLPARKPSQGTKVKDLLGMPWRVSFALQADGWCLRQEIIWHKPNPMPESVTDRCTKAHEQLFLLSKRAKYYYLSLIHI